jgi:hypothetical protein
MTPHCSKGVSLSLHCNNPVNFSIRSTNSAHTCLLRTAMAFFRRGFQLSETGLRSALVPEEFKVGERIDSCRSWGKFSTFGSLQGGHWLIWSCRKLTTFISMLPLSHLRVHKVAKVAAYHLGSMLECKFKAFNLIKCCQHVARGKFEASKGIKHCHCLAGKGTEWPAPRERRPEKVQGQTEGSGVRKSANISTSRANLLADSESPYFYWACRVASTSL